MAEVPTTGGPTPAPMTEDDWRHAVADREIQIGRLRAQVEQLTSSRGPLPPDALTVLARYATEPNGRTPLARVDSMAGSRASITVVSHPSDCQVTLTTDQSLSLGAALILAGYGVNVGDLRRWNGGSDRG